MVGNSRALRDVREQIGQVAVTPVTVLIRGETGTGKELVAWAIYDRRDRWSPQPFIEVNCAGIPDVELESELFGNEPGTFFGKGRRIGRFEQANGGTLFLDEIGDLGVSTQAKLLRVLRDKRFQRRGGTKTVGVDVRVIATTHRNLEEAIRRGSFREDLYHRLSEAVICLPPLRDRPEDVPELVRFFLQRYSDEFGCIEPSMPGPDAIACLQEQNWPGNVRELRNVIRQSLLLSRDSPISRDILERVLTQRHPSPLRDSPRLPSTLPMSSAAALNIPDYEFLREIGKGGFGEVWLVRTVTGGFRALKIIKRTTFEDRGIFYKEFAALKSYETRLIGGAMQESLVKIHHVGRNDEEGFYYYVMELADDCVKAERIDPATYKPRTLKTELAKRGRLSLQECVQIGIVLSEALQFLELQGLIHRDVKPANVIFVNGKAKLADIGLLAPVGGKTHVGTDGYVPPEGPGQMQGDIYALGKLLYEISTGQDRRECPTAPPGMTSEEIAFLGIVAKATHEQCDSRYRDAMELGQDLMAIRAKLQPAASP